MSNACAFAPHLSFAVPTLSTQTSPGRGIASPSPSPASPTVSFSSGITTPSTMQLRVGLVESTRRASERESELRHTM